VARGPSLSPVARLVREQDRDRFATALFAPVERREALWALYAFNYEVARAREAIREPMMGRIRLQWWRDAVAEIYDGRPPRRHEVVEPLAAAIRAGALSREHFDALLDARERDLDPDPPANLAALEAYADESSGRLVLLALEALGAREDAAAAAGRAIGTGYALAGLLRAIPFHARARRLYLPADLIADAKLDVARYLFELKPSPALSAVVEQVADAARRQLAAGRAQRAALPKAALPALLPGILADRWLARLARAGYDPFDRRLARPDGGRAARLGLAALRGRY
jgi:NADH dehydrogenase [ubiquinone] 1 alpha subcomplex assembly factor 6